MKNHKLVLAVAALMMFAGIGTMGVGTLFLIGGFKNYAELDDLRGTMTEVVVTRRPLKAGTLLAAEELVVRKMPSRYAQSNTIYYKDLEIYLGMPLAWDVPADGVMLTSDFAMSGGAERSKCASFVSRMTLFEPQ